MHCVVRVLLTGVLIAATACTGAQTRSASSPEATPSDNAVAETAPSAPVPSPLPALSEPGSTEPLGGTQAPPQCETASEGATTTCTTTVFEPEFTLELPADWLPDPGNPDLPNSSSYLSEDETGYLSFNRVSEVFNYKDGGPPQIVPAPSDLISYFSDLPAVDAGEVQPVTVAGRDGQQLDITITDAAGLEAPPDCGPPQAAVYVFNLAAPCEPFYFPIQEVVRLVIIDASRGGPALVISMEAFPPSARNKIFTDFDRILQSLQFHQQF